MRSPFTVDGIAYSVFVPEGGLKRSASVLDGENAGRVKNGGMTRDIIGTYYNYSLEIDTTATNTEEYDRLYEVLTAPVDSHIVAFPYGQTMLVFDAYISNVEDELKFIDEQTRTAYWGNMQVKFIAMQPQRRG